MHLFNVSGQIRKYDSIGAILDEYCRVRLEGYRLRKKYLLSKFGKERDIIDNQARFVREVKEGRFSRMASKNQWH